MEFQDFVYLVQNIFVHKGEGSFSSRPISRSLFRKLPRTFSSNVCRESAEKGAKRIEYTWAFGRRCHENNVTHPNSLVSDADFDDSADVHGEKFPIETPSKIPQYRSMKQDLSDSTISYTCCIVKSGQIVTGRRLSLWRLLFVNPSHLSTHHQPGV